jgi:GTP-binding protein
VDSLLEKGGKRYLFVDTAGIRRQRLLKEAVDHVSVVQAKKSIEHADVAILLLSAEEGLREMDATIAGYIQEAGRGIVIAVNKWDLAPARDVSQKSFGGEITRHLKFLPWAPTIYISAKTGRGLTALLAAAERVQAARTKRVTTGELNRLLARAQQAYAPKADKGNADVKILYGTQVGVAPPTFVISINHPVDLHFSYKRYLENQIREAFGFEGTPLVLKVRTRRH